MIHEYTKKTAEVAQRGLQKPLRVNAARSGYLESSRFSHHTTSFCIFCPEPRLPYTIRSNMNARISTLMTLLALMMVMASCESNPGWDGHNSANALEEIAEEGCKCVYEVMAEFEEFDAANVVDVVKEYKAGGETGDDEKFKDIKMAYAAKPQILDRVDASECMKPIEDAIFNKGFEYEDVQQVFAQHCSLSEFFRF